MSGNSNTGSNAIVGLFATATVLFFSTVIVRRALRCFDSNDQQKLLEAIQQADLPKFNIYLQKMISVGVTPDSIKLENMSLLAYVDLKLREAYVLQVAQQQDLEYQYKYQEEFGGSDCEDENQTAEQIDYSSVIEAYCAMLNNLRLYYTADDYNQDVTYFKLRTV